MREKYLAFSTIGLVLTTISLLALEGLFQYLIMGLGLVLLAFAAFKLLVTTPKSKRKNKS